MSNNVLWWSVKILNKKQLMCAWERERERERWKLFWFRLRQVGRQSRHVTIKLGLVRSTFFSEKEQFTPFHDRMAGEERLDQQLRNILGKIFSSKYLLVLFIYFTRSPGPDVINKCWKAKLCNTEVKHSDWMGLALTNHGALFQHW